jgi:Flp pilus assembly pilin Flp
MLFALRERGQSFIEYAIILSLVALISIAVLWLPDFRIGNSYSRISNSVP